MAKKKIDLNNEIDRLLSPEVRDELSKAPPSPAFQQFLIRYLDVRDSVIINFISDNDEFAGKIADKVRGHVAESYEQLAAVLLRIEKGQIDIINRLDIAEEKVKNEEIVLVNHEKRLQEKKERIRRLEEKYEEQRVLIEFVTKMEPVLISVSKLEPALRRVDKAFKWWKIVLYILAVGLLVFLAVAYSHKAGMLGFLKSDKHSYGTQMTIDEQMKILNAPTRAIHLKDLTGYAKDKKDSITDSGIQQDENEIEAGIKKRNEAYFKKYGHN